MHDSEEYVLQALDAGAFGYLLKDTDKTEFVKALKQIHGGNKYFSGAVSNVLANRLLNTKPFTNKSTNEAEDSLNTYNLTRREKEILQMVVEGKQNKQIAEASGKSVRTIETHRFNIMKKLGVNNAIDMVNKAMKENLV
jgi:DNA-binding NarL/FixJ family response regulator